MMRGRNMMVESPVLRSRATCCNCSCSMRKQASEGRGLYDLCAFPSSVVAEHILVSQCWG